MPVSMVLLHCESRTYDEEELRTAVEHAWKVTFTAPHFVTEFDGKAILHIGRHLISLLSRNQSYLEKKSEKFAKQLQNRDQQEAWMKHSAWTALDYIKGRDNVELQYCVLAKLAAELIDSNCTGIYIPRERSLIPNDAILYGELQKVAASRSSDF